MWLGGWLTVRTLLCLKNFGCGPRCGQLEAVLTVYPDAMSGRTDDEDLKVKGGGRGESGSQGR